MQLLRDIVIMRLFSYRDQVEVGGPSCANSGIFLGQMERTSSKGPAGLPRQQCLESKEGQRGKLPEASSPWKGLLPVKLGGDLGAPFLPGPVSTSMLWR